MAYMMKSPSSLNVFHTKLIHALSLDFCKRLIFFACNQYRSQSFSKLIPRYNEVHSNDVTRFLENQFEFRIHVRDRKCDEKGEGVILHVFVRSGPERFSGLLSERNSAQMKNINSRSHILDILPC